jgi:hypothetical protein
MSRSTWIKATFAALARAALTTVNVGHAQQPPTGEAGCES